MVNHESRMCNTMLQGGLTTLGLIESLVPIVDLIIVVDDNCPLKTGDMIIDKFTSSKVQVQKNEINEGVGFSTKRGLRELVKQGCDVVVKLDADGQIKPHLIPTLIKPILTGRAEAAKGNRFTSLDNIVKMPKIRIIGNLGLSFINKLSTGYWEYLIQLMAL